MPCSVHHRPNGPIEEAQYFEKYGGWKSEADRKKGLEAADKAIDKEKRTDYLKWLRDFVKRHPSANNQKFLEEQLAKEQVSDQSEFNGR